MGLFGSEAEQALDGTDALAEPEVRLDWTGLDWAGLGWAEPRASSPLPGAKPGPLQQKHLGRKYKGIMTRVIMNHQCNALCFISFGKRCHSLYICNSWWLVGEIMSTGHLHRPFYLPRLTWFW